jgi:hypothetical protein
MSWIQTYTGLEFRYDELDLDTICLEDIARALSQQSRFLGHLHNYYSTAEHSYYVSQRAEVLAADRGLSRLGILTCARWGHLHDASEAYVGDLPAPMKQLPFMEGYVRLEKEIQAAIKIKFGIATTPEMEAIVRQADLELCNTERLALLGPPPTAWQPLPPPLDIRLHCFSPIQAERAFLARWRSL